MSLDVKYIKINFLLPRRMCGPIEKCCCCFPAKVGVKFIGGILILVELVGVIYITVILSKNNKVPMEFKICMCYSIQIRHFQAFHEVLDTDLPGYSAYMTGAIMGFIILVGCNLLLIYGSAKKLQALTFACVENTILFDTPNQYRYYFIPWLVVYLLSIIGLMIGAMVIIVYFAIIFPIPSIAALCVIPILSGLILLYW